MNKIKRTEIEALFPLIEEKIKSGGEVKIKVTGYSMYPLVSNRRDSVLLTKADKIKKGDVPLFKRADGTCVLHRIVGVKNNAFVLRGDYEQKKEYPVYPEQVVAVAKGFYRKEKYISCESTFYKLYKFFWMNTVFLRPLFLKLLAIRATKIQKK